jgi:hypothetical protein
MQPQKKPSVPFKDGVHGSEKDNVRKDCVKNDSVRKSGPREQLHPERLHPKNNRILLHLHPHAAPVNSLTRT